MMRVAMAAAGVVLIGYGVVLLLENPWPTLLRIALWALAGVLLHDFVFAPAVTALGYAGRRILPRSSWTPVAVAALVSVTLILLAVPVFDRPGARPTNPSVLDRDYPAGLWIALAIVWAVTLVSLGFVEFKRGPPPQKLHKSPVGEDEVVQQQRTDDVDGQPPSA